MKPQIATTIEQSHRLLSCGVDPKTADMVWLNRGQYPAFLSFNEGCNRAIPEVGDVPAWSLSALCSLLPKRIKTNNACLTIVADYNEWNVGYEYDSLIGRGIETVKSFNAHNLIEACVQMIEWLMEQGYSLNKIEK